MERQPDQHSRWRALRQRCGNFVLTSLEKADDALDVYDPDSELQDTQPIDVVAIRRALGEDESHIIRGEE